MRKTNTYLFLDLGNGNIHVLLTVFQNLYDVITRVGWLGESRDQILKNRGIRHKSPRTNNLNLKGVKTSI